MGRDDHLRLEYQVLTDFDALHRCLLRQEDTDSPVILHRDAPFLELAPAGLVPEVRRSRMIREGLHHIWTGYDHLLFLLALLLPAVLRRSSSGWLPADRPGAVLLEVVRVVTAFTVAHSVTLVLGTLGWIRLPSRWVESTIAASIAVAAGLMLLPGHPREEGRGRIWPPHQVWSRTWVIAFVFGLIHGFGFASMLAELDLPAHRLLLALLEFNLGVELGQLAVVAAVLPLALLLRRQACYRNWILPGGATVMLLIAMGWLAERALDLQFMPF